MFHPLHESTMRVINVNKLFQMVHLRHHTLRQVTIRYRRLLKVPTIRYGQAGPQSAPTWGHTQDRFFGLYFDDSLLVLAFVSKLHRILAELRLTVVSKLCILVTRQMLNLQ